MEHTSNYVIVIHSPTKRGFSLNRAYQLLDSLIENAQPPADIVDVFDGWLPTMEFQRPEWINGLPEAEFTAYWYF